MQQKILEIIEILISEMDRLPDKAFPDLDIISEKLLKKGYTERDIQTAVEWIFDFIIEKDREGVEQLTSGTEQQPIRLFSHFERKMFSNEAYGFLIQLQILGLMTPVQVEQIIDRSIMSGLEIIGEEEVRRIASQILLGRKTTLSRTRSLFHPGNETIH